MEKLGIRAMGISGANNKADYRLWKKADKGRWQVVLACPEALLGPRSHFFTKTVRNPNAFMQNLCAIVVDECHLVWNWKEFRVMYASLGRLRQCCKGVPWMCLSATLTPGAEAFVHEVCKLKCETMRISITIRRRNINFMVSTQTLPGYQHLYDLIPSDTTSPEEIPKTLIFVDSVIEAIVMARDLRERLQDTVNTNLPIARPQIDPETTIRTYFAPNDDPANSATLSQVRNGATRICICTEAFGLGVNIPDVVRVIQWGITTLLQSASLFQRAGRAARDKNHLGIAQVYVQKSIMKALPKDCDNFAEIFSASISSRRIQDFEGNEVGDFDDARVIGNTEKKHLEKFLLPVEADNHALVDSMVGDLYRAARDLRSAHREDTKEKIGTKENPVPTLEKIDPGILWLIATRGCRWRVFLSLFKDPDVLGLHESWCCDSCALASGLDPSTITHGIALGKSAEYERAYPVKHPQKKRNTEGVQKRHESCEERYEQLEQVLRNWREAVFEYLKLPNVLLPSMVLPNSVVAHLVKNSRIIVNVNNLRKCLQKAGVSIESSLLTDELIEHLFKQIDQTLDMGLGKSRVLRQADQTSVGS